MRVSCVIIGSCGTVLYLRRYCTFGSCGTVPSAVPTQKRDTLISCPLVTRFPAGGNTANYMIVFQGDDGPLPQPMRSRTPRLASGHDKNQLTLAELGFKNRQQLVVSQVRGVCMASRPASRPAFRPATALTLTHDSFHSLNGTVVRVDGEGWRGPRLPRADVFFQCA